MKPTNLALAPVIESHISLTKAAGGSFTVTEAANELALIPRPHLAIAQQPLRTISAEHYAQMTMRGSDCF